MNETEMAKVMAVLHSAWNKGWDDDNVQFWWVRFREMNCTLDDCLAAVKALSDTHTFRPEWADFRAEVQRFRHERLQHEAEAKALTAPRDEDEAQQRQVNVTGLRLVRKAAEQIILGANLTPNGMGLALDFTLSHGNRGHRHNRGAEHCPVCKRHDHKDTRTIGFAASTFWSLKLDGTSARFESNEPIPAWHLTCPRCGVTDFPELVCDSWTPLGATLMRERKQPQPDQHLAESDF